MHPQTNETQATLTLTRRLQRTVSNGSAYRTGRRTDDPLDPTRQQRLASRGASPVPPIRPR